MTQPELPVLDLRRLRRFYGARPLTRPELGKRADLSARQVRYYETMTRLPRSLQHLLALAAALDVPVEMLLTERVRRGGTPRP